MMFHRCLQTLFPPTHEIVNGIKFTLNRLCEQKLATSTQDTKHPPSTLAKCMHLHPPSHTHTLTLLPHTLTHSHSHPPHTHTHAHSSWRWSLGGRRNSCCLSLATWVGPCRRRLSPRETTPTTAPRPPASHPLITSTPSQTQTVYQIWPSVLRDLRMAVLYWRSRQ